MYKFGTIDEIGKNLGSYDYILNQFLHIQKRGVQLVVLAPWVTWYKRGSQEVNGIQVVRYWPPLVNKSWRTLLLYKIINKFYIWRTGQVVKKVSGTLHPDIVYVRQARETGYAVARVKLNIGAPLVFQPITTWRWHFDQKSTPWWRKLAKDVGSQQCYANLILKQFDHFITYNNAMIDEYVGMGADRNKFTIIPPAVKHDLFSPSVHKLELRKQLGLPLDKKIILNVGRINLAEKGQGYLLKAFRMVADRDPNAYLVIIGPGTTEQQSQLMSLIQELQLEDRVSYLGSKAYNDLPQYMNASDLGVMASIWFEAFGRTTLDMLSCGLPMVTTTVGGMVENNVDGETGLHVPPENGDVMGEAIYRILSDKQLREQMAKNARQRVLDVYTFEKVTNRFMELFNRIAKQ